MGTTGVLNQPTFVMGLVRDRLTAPEANRQRDGVEVGAAVTGRKRVGLRGSTCESLSELDS